MSATLSPSTAVAACFAHDGTWQIFATKLHRHAWCAHDGEPRFDRWEEAIVGGMLSGAFGLPTGRMLLAEALADGRCPECQTKLDLQDRARGNWWCAHCRRWLTDKG